MLPDYMASPAAEAYSSESSRVMGGTYLLTLKTCFQTSATLTGTMSSTLARRAAAEASAPTPTRTMPVIGALAASLRDSQ